MIIILQNWVISTWFRANYQYALHGLMFSSFELRENRRDWTPYIITQQRGQHANRLEGHWTSDLLITYDSILTWVTVDFADCFIDMVWNNFLWALLPVHFQLHYPWTTDISEAEVVLLQNLLDKLRMYGVLGSYCVVLSFTHMLTS